MNEFLLGAGKPTLPGPTGDITGTVQRMGQMTGLVNVYLSRSYGLKDGEVWFGIGGRRTSASGPVNGQMQALDLETLAVTATASDALSGPQDRQVDFSEDGSLLYMYGGNYNNTQTILTAAQTVAPYTRTVGSWGTGRNALNFGHGRRGSNVYLLASDNTTFCYRLSFTDLSTTQLTGRAPDASAKGWSCCTVGDIIYMVARTSGSMRAFNMSTETWAIKTATGRQVWSDGAYDNQGNIYWLAGSDTGFGFYVIKYNIATDTATSIALKGQTPAAAYTGEYLYLVWYKNALYFFRANQATADGLQLYRII